MIGKPEWFTRRKYTGWGLQPKTWQGWAYIAIFLIPFIIFNAIAPWSTQTRLIAGGIWALLLIIDVFDIMRKLNQDEREKIHEAIAERNALWGILIVIIAGIFYDIITNAIQEKIYVHPFLVGALIVGVAIKCVSNIYLDRTN